MTRESVQPPQASRRKRIAIRLGAAAAGAAVLGALAVDGRFSANASSSVRSSESAASASPFSPKNREVGFPRPEDIGDVNYFPGDAGMFAKNYPELSGILPQVASGYRREEGTPLHRYYEFTRDPFLHAQALFRAREIDEAFRQSADLIRGEIDGVRFSARLRPEAESSLSVVPPHFPKPGEKPPRRLPEDADWMHTVDPDTGTSFAVIRAEDPAEADIIERRMSINDVFGAVSAAKSLDIVADGDEVLSPDQVKDVLSALGKAVLAKRIHRPGDEFADIIAAEFGVTLDGEFYGSVPNIAPVFPLY